MIHGDSIYPNSTIRFHKWINHGGFRLDLVTTNSLVRNAKFCEQVGVSRFALLDAGLESKNIIYESIRTLI